MFKLDTVDEDYSRLDVGLEKKSEKETVCNVCNH